MNSRPEHERLFDEITNKLYELSNKSNLSIDSAAEEGTRQHMLEKMQGQIRKFQNDLQGTQDELRDKIKNLENLQYHQGDLGQQMLLLSEQLNHERNTNSKLNADLAKSLELSLQLQLEIQGLKSRTHQNHLEEKKYSQSLVEKLMGLQNEVELQKALKDEMDLELDKAKASFLKQQETWLEEKAQFQMTLDQLTQMMSQLTEQIDLKNIHIKSLNDELSNISSSFEELEASANKQNDVLKTLMETAETKIIEMKMALDRKSLECKDYYNHLQQSLTQCSLLKSENSNLKDHIEKMNIYIQQTQNEIEGI